MAVLLVVICQMQKYYIRQSLKENTEHLRLMAHKIFSGYAFALLIMLFIPLNNFRAVLAFSSIWLVKLQNFIKLICE